MPSLLRHLARTITLMLLLALSSPLAVTAADPPTTLPGLAQFESGVTIDFLVSGQIDSGISSTPHVIVERIELDTDEVVPFADAIQIIAVLEGRLVMVDDLGLPASLKKGKQTFAPSGAFFRIRAAEPTTLLRARIASLDVDITIFDDRCDPAALTRASGSTLQIKNATGETQPFTISSLDIAVDIPAGQIASISLQDVEAANWVASCGKKPASNAPIDVVTLTVSNVAPAPAITPAAESPETSVLFDDSMTLADDSSPTFSFAQLEIAPAGSLGEQAFPGPTGIIAGEQSLRIERAGKPAATLKAGANVLLPAETVATISNPNEAATETWIVSMNPLVEVIAEPPAPTAAPEPVETPGETDPAAALYDYLPSEAAMSDLGMNARASRQITSFEDIGVPIPDFESEWVASVYGIFEPESEGTGIAIGLIFVDQFQTSTPGELLINGILANASSAINTTLIDLPASSVHLAAGYVVTEATDEGESLVIIRAAYGNVVVSIAIFTEAGAEEAGVQLAIDVLAAVDATRP